MQNLDDIKFSRLLWLKTWSAPFCLTTMSDGSAVPAEPNAFISKIPLLLCLFQKYDLLAELPLLRCSPRIIALKQ